MKSVWAGAQLVVMLAIAQVTYAQAAPEREDPPSADDSGAYERAREQFGQGTQAYQHADYARAREHFARAHALAPGAATWRALGFCDFQLKAYAQAANELRAALAEQRSHKALTDAEQREVRTIIDKLSPLVGRVVIELEPPDASVRVDGSPTTDRDFFLLAGEHSLIASAPSYIEHTHKLTIAGGGQQHARLELTPKKPALQEALAPSAEVHNAQPGEADPRMLERSGQRADDAAVDPAAAGRTRGIIGLSVGGAALVTGIVTGSLSIMKTANEEHHCVDGHCPLESADALSMANTLANVSNVALALGAVGVLYGVYELLTLPTSKAELASQRGLRVSVGGAGVTLHGRL